MRARDETSRVIHDRYVLIIYDHKQASEGLTRPDLRRPPLNISRMKKCVGAAIEARREAMNVDAAGIIPGDLYFLADGSKPRLTTKFRALSGT